MSKIVFLHHCCLALRSRSKFGVKVKGWNQGHRSRSKSNPWSTAVDIRGSTLPSASKSNKSHYQSNVFVRVSVRASAGYCTDAVDWLITSCVSKIDNVFCPVCVSMCLSVCLRCNKSIRTGKTGISRGGIPDSEMFRGSAEFHVFPQVLIIFEISANLRTPWKVWWGVISEYTWPSGMVHLSKIFWFYDPPPIGGDLILRPPPQISVTPAPW